MGPNGPRVTWHLSAVACLAAALALAAPEASHAVPIGLLSQIGTNGDTGTGGVGGGGGANGSAGFYYYVGTGSKPGWQPNDGSPGGRGGQGGTGGTGGPGGQGTLVVEGMGAGEALRNFGNILVGGASGGSGAAGVIGRSSGGKGGDGGARFYGGHTGAEPNPDPWPTTQQGGARGGYLGNGADGGTGGGGGGGGDGGFNPWALHVIVDPLFGNGGEGGGGAAGAKGAGGSGSSRAAETFIQSADAVLAAGNVLQIGGNGGRGGQGGQGGSGGGGGGGVGANVTGFSPFQIPFFFGPSSGGVGGGKGPAGVAGVGGVGGNGTVVIGEGGRLVNEATGSIQLGRGPGLESGALQVLYGGQLVNRGSIAVQNGGISLGFGAFVRNSGSIDTAGADLLIPVSASVVNDGDLIVASLVNDGHLSGSGVISGNFTNHSLFDPGSSPGTMTIDGSYDEFWRLGIELGGTDASEHGAVVVLGDVFLAGLSVLDLGFFGSFDESGLSDGDSFDVVRYAGALSGAFDAIDYAGAPLARGTWSLSYDHDLGGGFKSARLTYLAIPEPAINLLLGLAMAGLALRRR